MTAHSLEIVPLTGIPIIEPGDDLASVIMKAFRRPRIRPRPGDVLVVTHSIVSMAEGRVFHNAEIEPSAKATQIAATTGRSAQKVEVALREAVEVIREEPVLITKTKQGIVTDFSGVDQKNAPLGSYIALPADPDESARRLHYRLSKELGVHMPVIITDTHGRPWRLGAVNAAIGVAGMSPFFRNAGKEDLYGRHLTSSLVCLADELAEAAELVMGQADEGIPVALIRGVKYESEPGAARDIVRAVSEDLFRGDPRFTTTGR